jgi:hypothetical protein
MGKEILRINMDETSVCLWQGDGKGTVFADKGRHRDGPVQKMSRSKRRACLTHVALVCDRPEVQARLPQLIIGNVFTFPAKSFAALQGARPPNVQLIRQKSAWNNTDLCAKLVRLLEAALKPYVDSFQPIFLFDAVRLHLSSRVLNACASAGIWPIVVPAKMTWLLQPLDTHAFQRYKAHLKLAYQHARVQARSDLDIGRFLLCLYETIRRVLQGVLWSSAFDRDGFGSGQARVSEYVQRQLQLQAPIRVPILRPTEEQIGLCFPKNAELPMAALFRLRPFDLPRKARKAIRDMPEAIPLLSLPGLPMVEPRTRAQRRAAEIAAVALHPPSSDVGPGAAASSSSSAIVPSLGRTRAETRRLRGSRRP